MDVKYALVLHTKHPELLIYNKRLERMYCEGTLVLWATTVDQAIWYAQNYGAPVTIYTSTEELKGHEHPIDLFNFLDESGMFYKWTPPTVVQLGPVHEGINNAVNRWKELFNA